MNYNNQSGIIGDGIEDSSSTTESNSTTENGSTTESTTSTPQTKKKSELDL